MTVPSILADRLVERLFGPKQVPPQQEAEPQQPPRSVHAQLADARKRRLESRRLMRQLRRF